MSRAAALVVLALFGSAVAAGASTGGQTCRASQLKVFFGPDLSSPTGRHDLSLRLVNRGSACRLRGYPGVSLFDGQGRALPFTIRRGGGMMVTARSPRLVRVRPGGSAWIVFEQYRCDLGSVAATRSAQLRLPGGGGTLRVGFGRGVGPAFCGKSDPGSTLYVSPVSGTQRAAVRP